MKREEVNEIIECLGDERRVFHYFKDRYCLDQLEYIMEKEGVDSLAINALKQGNLLGLLNKTIFKNNLGFFGNGQISKSDLNVLIPAETQTFVLGLATWGESDRGWDQTTRNQCNLVLRLNFTETMNKHYECLVKPTDCYGPFESWGHPVSKGRRKTLSWVRIDLDFDTNEALIEEIQNDWLRTAKHSLQYLKKKLAVDPSAKPSKFNRYIGGTIDDLEEYVEGILKPYDKIWAEASMCAALKFIRSDLGIQNVFYHSYDTGTKIKQVMGKPPRSLYTKLPKQFGFKLVDEAPFFIQKDKKASRYLRAIEDPSWYRLA